MCVCVCVYIYIYACFEKIGSFTEVMLYKHILRSLAALRRLSCVCICISMF